MCQHPRRDRRAALNKAARNRDVATVHRPRERRPAVVILGIPAGIHLERVSSKVSAPRPGAATGPSPWGRVIESRGLLRVSAVREHQPHRLDMRGGGGVAQRLAPKDVSL